ncbi:hypothetical protein QTP70_030629 [Hemibagrus guttatus]|uniref:Uncharacterized protein n=1 Tax=Hemibagrus guttatus TaxID=175788 RepID=A0AAE0QFB1_9TELE|nr:hypothetical protein QTP70_030629 [Hemibagrus guttatus]
MKWEGCDRKGISTVYRRIPCGDRQEHQIPWCASSRELHLVTHHHLHHQESPAAPLLPAEAEESPSTSPILTMFYRGTIEYVLSSCITAWFRNCTVSEHKTLQRIVRTAEKIIGVSLPSITDMYTTRCIRKANSIVDDPTHTLFTLLPSGKSNRQCTFLHGGVFYMVGGSLKSRGATQLDKVAKRAGSVVGVELDSLKQVVERRTLNKMLSIMANPDHPLHMVFCKQRSVFSGRLLSQSCSTDRLRKSFVPRAIQLFNTSQQGHRNVDREI